MHVGNIARVAFVGAALIAAAASASSTQDKPINNPSNQTTAPPSQPMDPAQALGLWKSSFGAVKIEPNDKGGQGAIHGVWVYDRNNQEVVGYFGGVLQGNVLQFTWQEPSDQGPPLSGAGYVVFDAYGQRFDGRWWTSSRDRTGEWTGWRAQPVAPPPQPGPPPQPTYGGGYGGATYGYQPPPPPPRGY